MGNQLNQESLLYEVDNKNSKSVKAIINHKKFDKNLLNSVSDQYWLTPLMMSGRNGFSDGVKYLLEAGSNPNIISRELRSVLHYTCEAGNLECIKLLFQFNADTKLIDKEGRFPLMYSCEKGHTEVSSMYLKRDNSMINHQDKHGRNCLMLACISNDFPTVQELVRLGAELNKVDKNGQTALMHSVNIAGTDCTKFLIEQGAELNVSDLEGNTLLLLLLEKNDLGLFAIEKGADFHVINKKGFTPLILAAEFNRLDALSVMIRRLNPDEVNVKYNNDYTALLIACSKNNQGCARELMSHGANINEKDRAGMTPLILACKHDNIKAIESDFVSVMIDRGAEVNAQSIDGSTAFMKAARAMNVVNLRILLKRGADPNIKTRNGERAEDIVYPHFRLALQALIEKSLKGEEEPSSQSPSRPVSGVPASVSRPVSGVPTSVSRPVSGVPIANTTSVNPPPVIATPVNTTTEEVDWW